MARYRHPNLLETITGTHRQPSTRDVITLCWEADRAIERSRHTFECDPIMDDCRAILDQVEWLFAAFQSEENSDRKADYECLSAELLGMHHLLLRQASKPNTVRSDVWDLLTGFLKITATYALAVAFNCILLSGLYALLTLGVLMILQLIVP